MDLELISALDCAVGIKLQLPEAAPGLRKREAAPLSFDPRALCSVKLLWVQCVRQRKCAGRLRTGVVKKYIFFSVLLFPRSEMGEEKQWSLLCSQSPKLQPRGMFKS